MAQFRTLSEAAAHCEKVGCPFAWVSKANGGYRVARPKNAAKKKTKKKAKKRSTKKRSTKKSNPKKATPRRTTTTKKRSTKKRATKKKHPGPWGASIAGDTPRAVFMRRQKRAGRTPGQARASWKLSRAAKARGKSSPKKRSSGNPKKKRPKKWLKKAIKRPGRCRVMGSEDCPVGSPQYRLAKRLKPGGDLYRGGA